MRRIIRLTIAEHVKADEIGRRLRVHRGKGDISAAKGHAHPFTAGLRYLGKLTVNAHGPAEDIGWLLGPVALAILLPAVLFVVGDRLALRPGDRA